MTTKNIINEPEAETTDETRRPMPTIDYTDFIRDLARAQAARQTATAEPRWLENNPNFEEHKFQESVQCLEEKIDEWTELGNHYADVLEDPSTSATLHNTIGEDLDELVDRANLHLTSAEVLRLLYPLLRFREVDNRRDTPLTISATEPSPSVGAANITTEEGVH